jgi:hypothetical protein
LSCVFNKKGEALRPRLLPVFSNSVEEQKYMSTDPDEAQTIRLLAEYLQTFRGVLSHACDFRERSPILEVYVGGMFVTL